MSIELTWHGHSNFQLQSRDCNILIDPFFSANPQARTSWESIDRPDVVLVTHMHGDHCGDAVDICKKTGAKLGAIVELATYLVENGILRAQILNGIGFNIGGTILANGVEISMTEAFHSSECSVPTGFIMHFPDGFTVYHAGDTGIFANMAIWGELYSIDLAMLPIGGIFTMDGRQAAKAAALLKARSVIPMHWGTFEILEQDCSVFEKELALAAPDCRCLVMNPDDKIKVGV